MRDDKSFISLTILSTRTLSTQKNYSQKILEPMRTRVLPSAMAMG